MPKTETAIIGMGAMGVELLYQLGEKENSSLEVGALVSRGGADQYIQPIRFDSLHPGRGVKEVVAEEDQLIIDGKKIPFQQFSYQNNGNGKITNVEDLTIINEQGVELIFEATGQVKSIENAKNLIDQTGASLMLIPSPAKNGIPTRIVGINHEDWDPNKEPVVGLESCSTNCAVHPTKVLLERFGVARMFGISTHTRTGTNVLIDKKATHKDPRRARSAALNIIPTSTGADRGLIRAIPELTDVPVNIVSRRVPVDNVSLLDLHVEVEKPITTRELLEALEEEAMGSLLGIMAIGEKNSVSTMYADSKETSIIDPNETRVLGDGGRDTHVLISAWYANVVGPSAGAIKMAEHMAKNK